MNRSGALCLLACLGGVPADAGQQNNQGAAAAGASRVAVSAQTADAGALSDADGSVRPYLTVRFFAGPGVNRMRDWRDGFAALEGMAGG